MKKAIITAVIILISCASYGQSSYVERDSVAHTAPFRSKVKMAVHIAAGNILADPQQAETVRKYAQGVISDPDGSQWLPALTWGVLTNAAINWDSSDNDILFTVNSIFSKYAYAYYRELPEE